MRRARGASLTILAGVALALLTRSSIVGGSGLTSDPGAARLSRAAEATEYWSATARLDGGYRLFARFGITNEGPGEQSAGALWYLAHPDGHVTELRNGRAQGNWKLSPDHLRIDVASSSLDLHAPMSRLAIDTTSQGAKIFLQFPAASIPVRTAAAPPKLQTEILHLAAPVEGTIQLRGMAEPITVHGTLALTHAWVDESVATLVRRTVELVGVAPDVAVYLLDVMSPAGAHTRQLVIQRGGVTVYQTADVDVAFDPDTRGGAAMYPVPAELVIRSDRLVLSARTERSLVRTAPMDRVPQPFRFLFSLKIDPRWMWTDAMFHLKLDGGDGEAAIDTDGEGTLALNYLNPLPAK